MQIGNKMRQRREQLKWSQEYVAEKLNMRIESIIS